MHTLKSTKIAAIVVASLLAVGGLVAAAPKEESKAKADFAKQGDKWILANDAISVWFHATPSGKAKPMLKVFSTDADGNVSGYKMKITRLCEVAANATDCSAAYASMNLARADNWTVDYEHGNGTVNITMRLTEASRGTVELLFHLRDDRPSVKFDLNVANWRWSEGAVAGVPAVTNRTLALEMHVDERHEGSVDGADASDANVTVRDGWLSWASTAEASYSGALTRTLNVTGAASHDAEEGDQRVFLRFDGQGGFTHLAYDPEFGVGTQSAGEAPSSPIPAPAILLTVAAVAGLVVVLAAGRRRR